MKIFASVYNGNAEEVLPVVKDLDYYRVDAYHIDCHDDLGIFPIIRKIRSFSTTPIEVHIITSEPEKFFKELIETKVEYVVFQYENLNDELVFPSEMNCKTGLAITSDTKIEVFEKYAGKVDYIQFMTTKPGISGQSFNPNTFKRIRKFRKKFPETTIHVDGGVNAEISFILRDLGVSGIVSGSFLKNFRNYGKALLELKSTDIKSDYKVKDFMIDPEDLPVLSIESARVAKILDVTDKFKLGFSLFIDKDGYFKGVTNNADIRRGFMKNYHDFNEVKAADIINPNPVCIHEEATVTHMLELINKLEYPVLFLPVIDDASKLKGAVTFNNLLRNNL